MCVVAYHLNMKRKVKEFWLLSHNEKVFEGRDENYMVLEAYAGKYSIWLSNKEAAQGKV